METKAFSKSLFLVSLILCLGTNLKAKEVGWSYLDYPWIYGAQSNSWSLLQSYGDTLWGYDMVEKSWNYYGMDSVVQSNEEEVSTIDELLGKIIFIEDNWAGRSLELKKVEGEYTMTWSLNGSGVPVIESSDHTCEIISERVLEFTKDEKEYRVIIHGGTELRLYIDGVRVFVTILPI